MFQQHKTGDVRACKNVFFFENGHIDFAAFTFIVVLDVDAAVRCLEAVGIGDAFPFVQQETAKPCAAVVF